MVPFRGEVVYGSVVVPEKVFQALLAIARRTLTAKMTSRIAVDCARSR
jgi:hypothetical protein